MIGVLCSVFCALQAVFCACSCSAFLNCAILLCMMVLVQNNLEEELIRKYNFHEQSFFSCFLTKTKNIHGCNGINNELTNWNLKIRSYSTWEEENKTVCKYKTRKNWKWISHIRTLHECKDISFFCSAWKPTNSLRKILLFIHNMFYNE